MIVRPPATPEEFQRYRDLRWKILRAPYNQPKITENDDAGIKDYPIMVCEVDGISNWCRQSAFYFRKMKHKSVRYLLKKNCQVRELVQLY